MTEKEIIAKVAEDRGLSLTESKELVNYFVDLYVNGTQEDGKMVFGKVGTFKMVDVKATPARTGVKNPLTGGTYDVAAKPARKKLTFSLSKSGKFIGA